MKVSDGMNYMPESRPGAVVKPGEFVFSVAALDHGHIGGMTRALCDAGGVLKSVYDRDPAKAEAFAAAHPGAVAVRNLDEILTDPAVHMVAAASITNERAPLGVMCMNAGKDYFTDKAPLTTLAQLEQVKETVARTGRKFMVYYSERLHVESAVYAGYLVKAGEIGRVIQVLGMGPHRLGAAGRPAWFFNHEQYGGILCDIGSHQIEQFLFYTGEEDARISRSHVANYAHPEYPELEDFGDCALVGAKGADGYFRVDWFTPDGLSTWGDGRLFILGTEGYIELRKYVDVGVGTGNVVNWVNASGEHQENVTGKVGYPFFGQLILDCLNRTENAMTQAHALKAAELCVRAQLAAEHIG